MDDHTKLKVKMKTSQTKFVGVFFFVPFVCNDTNLYPSSFFSWLFFDVVFFAENESEKKNNN